MNPFDMNPFDWNGPDFIVFYLAAAAALIAAQFWMRRMREEEAHSSGNPPQLADPYLVACLAGGVNGLLRCTTVALVEEKVLRVADTKAKDELILDASVHRQAQSPLRDLVANYFAAAGPRARRQALLRVSRWL